MTQLDVMYRFAANPSEASAMALGRIREVYGIRRLTVNQAEHTVRVEYDSSRLTEATVHGLLRRSGLDLVERVALVPAQPAALAASAPPPAKA